MSWHFWTFNNCQAGHCYGLCHLILTATLFYRCWNWNLGRLNNGLIDTHVQSVELEFKLRVVHIWSPYIFAFYNSTFLGNYKELILKQRGTWSQAIRVEISAPPFALSVTKHKAFNLSVLPFPHNKIRENTNIYVTVLSGKFKGAAQIQGSVLCL